MNNQAQPLANMSDEELQAELARRQQSKKAGAVPQQLPSLDFSPLIKICQDYINDLAREGYADDDYDHYIYETAIECVFGEDVWSWINSVIS